MKFVKCEENINQIFFHLKISLHATKIPCYTFNKPFDNTLFRTLKRKSFTLFNTCTWYSFMNSHLKYRTMHCKHHRSCLHYLVSLANHLVVLLEFIMKLKLFDVISLFLMKFKSLDVSSELETRRRRKKNVTSRNYGSWNVNNEWYLIEEKF